MAGSAYGPINANNTTIVEDMAGRHNEMRNRLDTLEAHGHPPADATTLDGLDSTAFEKVSSKNVASGYAGLDTNARVPTTRLGSGTANSSTFLRGDQTYAAPPGSSLASTVESERIFGIATKVGTSGSSARADHSHGTPDSPIPAHESAVNPHPGLSSDISAVQNNLDAHAGNTALHGGGSGSGATSASQLSYDDKALNLGATDAQRALVGVSGRGDSALARHARRIHGDHGITDFSKVSAAYKQSATAQRPSATSVGMGYQWYDNQLFKPIWSDGTNWRDANGTVV